MEVIYGINHNRRREARRPVGDWLVISARDVRNKQHLKFQDIILGSRTKLACLDVECEEESRIMLRFFI